MPKAMPVLLVALLALALGAGPAAAQEAVDVQVREASLGTDGDTRLIVSVAGNLPDDALTLDAFRVTENGGDVELAELQPLLEARTRSVTVGLLLDTSGSTVGAPLERAKAAATSFVADLVAKDVTVALYAFADEVRQLTAPTRNAATLLGAIADLEAAGETALYDAVVRASRDLDELTGLRNLVLFTDGGDTVSNSTLSEAVSAAGQASIPVSVVALLTPEQDLAALQQLGPLTGGSVTEATDVEALAGAFDTVEQALTNQYVITYRGTLHEPEELDLVVALTLPGGASDQDRLTVVNPRVAPGLAPNELPSLDLAEPGPLAGDLGLWLGSGAAFVALALLFAVLGTSATSAFDESRLSRRLKVYTQGGVDTHRDAWRPAAVQSAVADVVDRLPKPDGFESGLQLKLERAGWPIRASEFVSIQVMSAIGAGLGFGLLFASPALGLFGFVVAPLLVYLFLSNRITRRHNAFMEQLPETLGLLAGSLKAGYGLLQAADTVSQEAAEPTSSEFKRAMTEARLGMPLTEALDGIAERVDSDDYRWVVMAINIQNEVGGNLAQLLTTVAATLRGREQVRRQVKTLSAEGRISAYVLIALPFMLAGFLVLRQPEYVSVLFTHPLGRMMTGGVLVLMVAGILWIRNMIRIDV